MHLHLRAQFVLAAFAVEYSLIYQQTVLLKPAKGKYTGFQLTKFLGLKLTTPNS